LTVDGLGKAMPLDSERKREARAKNRRVEITIVK
jgi:flagellar motor protein MotB